MRPTIFTLLTAGLAALSSAGHLNAQTIRAGHKLLQESSITVSMSAGVSVDPLSFKSVSGESFYVNHAAANSKPVAFLFMSTKCPLVKRYTMRLRRLHESYGEQVDFFAVFPNSDETRSGISEFAADVEYPFPAVRDVNGYLSRKLGATMTPQAFLVDSAGVLRYRGAIDDQRYENRVKHRFLRDAIEAIVDGLPVEVVSTKAMGCSIHQAVEPSAQEVTYTTHIARILQDNCQSCHRKGQVAPFSLANYREARQWATEIKAYTQNRVMPPWSASPLVGKFSNDLSLTDQEIQLLAGWVDAGAPEGPSEDMPPNPQFSDGWAFGEPDLIVEMPEEYVINPEGEDDYRHFIIPYEATADRFVEAVDVRPGNRNVVHHVIGYVDTSGQARELDDADEGPGYTRFGDVGFKPASTIGGWAPGNRPYRTPPGSGRWLPKKCDIVLQVHYYRTGVEERDRTKLGIYFSKATQPVAVRMAVPINNGFEVPAGARAYEVRAQRTIKKSAYLFSITPHMHMIGETMEVNATLPGGKRLPLIRIDDWDFNWQATYRYRDLTLLPAGTKIDLVATYDNSADNPNNPSSPPRVVRWGEKTTDEMCLAFLGLLRESEYDPTENGRRTGKQLEETVASASD